MPGGGRVTLNVSPLKVTLDAGHTAVQKVTVTNGGPQPITLSARPMNVVAVKGECSIVPAPRTQMHISSVGTLQPGQSKVAVVDFHSPAVPEDVAAVFAATPAGGQSAGGGHAAAAVGVQFITTGHGTAAPVCSHHQVAAPHGSQGLGPLFVGVVIVAVLAAVACLTVMRLRRHRRT